jgi:diguanylate cyclase (GGDEF)-like protein
MAKLELFKNISRIAEFLLEEKDIGSVFDTIAKTACSFFNASASAIMLFDKDREYLTIAHTHNLSAKYKNVLRVHKDQEIAGSVCQQKKIRFVSNMVKLYKKLHDDATLKWVEKEGLISCVCAPLILKNEAIGCLNIFYRTPQRSFKGKKALEFFTKLAALSIAHARLIQGGEEKTRMISVLEQIGLLLTSSLDFDEITTDVLVMAASLSHGDTSSLILIDETTRKILDAYEYVKGQDKPIRYKSTARLSDGVSGTILKTRKPIVIANLERYRHVNPVALEKGRAAVIAVPLIAREKMIGIIYVNSFTPKEFTKNDIDYLTILCNQAAVALDNTLLYNKISREAKETAILYEVGQTFISTLDFEQLLNNILKRLKETFGYLTLEIYLVDEETQELYARSSTKDSDDLKQIRLKIGKDGITGYVAATRKMYYCSDVSKDSHYISGLAEVRSEVCFPLLIGDRLIGVLNVESKETNGFTPEAINLLSILSAQIAIALENAWLYEETKKLSLTDPLTALPNRRSFNMFLATEIKRAVRYHRPFSILMIDFDDFKVYNDRFGHPAGDAILQKFSQLMKETIRDVDFLGRYGGDEFIAVLPETDTSFALEVAERIRNKIAAQEIGVKITVSVGIASFPEDIRDKRGLIELADQACYEAKQLGGNNVKFASELHVKEEL